MSLIDCNGKIWDVHAPALRRHFGARLDDPHFVEFLIRNLGYLQIERKSTSHIIRCTPGRISLTAYRTAIGLIRQIPIERALLVWFDGSWHHEISSGVEVISQRLLKLALAAEGTRSRRHLSICHAMEPSRLAAPQATLFAFWQANAGRCDLHEHAETLSVATDGKFFVVRREPETQQLKFAQIGAGVDAYRGIDWNRRSAGIRVEHQPDLSYGAFVASLYREALLGDGPTLTSIDAVIFEPKRKTSRRRRYVRLDLPFVSPAGEKHLLCASVPDPTINLRFEIGDEAERIVD